MVLLNGFLNAVTAFSNFVLIPATSYGAQLALGALGITLIYAVLRFSDLAHSDIMAFGTAVTILVTWILQGAGIQLGIFPTAILALPVGIVTTMVVLMAIDRGVYRFYRQQKAKPIIFMIASLGVMFIMNGIVRLVIGVADRQFADGERFLITVQHYRALTGLTEGLALRTTQVITVVTAVALVAWLFWFLNHTRTGQSMRAYADNEDLALLSGINPEKVVRTTWIVVAVLVTTAGVLYGLDKSFKPFTYFLLLIPLFSAAILGGIGNPVGAICGAFIISFSEIGLTFAFRKVFNYLVPESWHTSNLLQIISTEYKHAISFMILILVLVFRPSGIFKGKSI